MSQTATRACGKGSCQCEDCKAACRYKPGWFLPGEVELVASYLDISLPELFATKLAVDWWVGDKDVFVLLPAILNGEAGTEFPADPRGYCVFFKDDLCAIHPVKPYECHEMNHDESQHARESRHEQVADAWKSHQSEITQLLGRKPESAPFTIFDAFGLGLFGD